MAIQSGLWIALYFGVGFLAAAPLNAMAMLLLDRASWPRRLLAVVLSASTLLIPFLLDIPSLGRAVAANVFVVAFIRVLEAARVPAESTRRSRFIGVFTPLETRMMKRAAKVLPFRAVLKGLSFSAAGVAAFLALEYLGPPLGPYAELSGWPRWISGAAGGYLLFEGLADLGFATVRPFGWEHEPLQRTPIQSRTLTEFWGQRWNRLMSLWFKKNLFEPFVRLRAPRAGLLAAFVASGAIHAYIVLPAAGPIWALWAFSFFIAHGLLVLLEVKLRVRRWPKLAAHGFTLLMFVATLPLFVEPFLRAAGL